jgi:hypothetical protein
LPASTGFDRLLTRAKRVTIPFSRTCSGNSQKILTCYYVIK